MRLFLLDHYRFDRSGSAFVPTGFDGKATDPAQLDRLADMMLSQNRVRQAELLSHRAAELRAQVTA